MMRSAGGALAVAVAALIVCCNADPHQEQDLSGSDHNSGERYDAADYTQNQELEDFLRFLLQYENKVTGRNNLHGIGGNTLLGRNIDGYYARHGLGGLGGNTMLGRNLHNIGGSSMLGRNLHGLGGSSLLGRDVEGDKAMHARFIDSLGGGNFVRNLDSLGGGNFVRNLDSLGGSNFVKKNLDALGGPNLVKRNLDSLGGGNLVRNLDSIGGGNFVRELDSLGGGHKTRNLEPLGGGNLVREVREIRHSAYMPYLISRRYEFGSPYGGKREPWPLAPIMYSGYYGDGLPKRNFDEIDRSGLDTFVKKRNFDEIDRSSMPFPYATKRFYHLYEPNYLDIDTPVSSFDKKRYRPDYPMDEIDLSHFPIGSKRSQDNFPLVPRNVL